MEIKHLMKRFTYKIEAKPEGGFIARSTDPTVPPLEAPTREELQQKIQANVVAALGEAFPGLKLPLESKQLKSKQLKFEVHVELKPGGGFSVHSDEPGKIEPVTQEKIDHFAEELLGFVDKNFPQLSQAIAARAAAGDIKVYANEQTGVTLNAGSEPGSAQGLPQDQLIGSSDARLVEGAGLGDATTGNSTINSVGIVNTPITPEASSGGTIFRILLALLIIAGLMYFFLHGR